MSDARRLTDPQDELFDVLDESGQPTGQRKARGDVHRDGDWHGALHIWVGGIGEDGPFVVFQRRSTSKDTWPSALDVAVGGHLRAGETLTEAVREAEEEIGLTLELGDLTRLGRRFARGSSERDNEVQEIFGVRSDLPLGAYALHPDEVAGIVAIPLGDALALFEGRREVVDGLELARGASSGADAGAVRVAVSDFAAGEVGGYAVRALQALREVVDGGAPKPFELR